MLCAECYRVFVDGATNRCKNLRRVQGMMEELSTYLSMYLICNLHYYQHHHYSAHAVSHTLAASLILRSIIQGGCENASLLHIRDLLRFDGVPNTDPGGSTYNGIDTDGISLEVQSVIASMEQLELHIDAVERFGKQCANPGSFMGALLAWLNHIPTLMGLSMAT